MSVRPSPRTATEGGPRRRPRRTSAAASRHFDPARADLVVVGDADLFYDALRRRRGNVERIPIGELNLDREALR